MRKTVDSRLGQRLKDRETLIGSSPRGARKLGIQLRPRATGAQGATVTFADGAELAVDAVVWATGFRLDHSLRASSRSSTTTGGVVHRRGVTDVPGLYFLGLPWQHTRGSALLGWVKDDAGVHRRAHRRARRDGRPAPAGVALARCGPTDRPGGLDRRLRIRRAGARGTRPAPG